MTGIRSWMSATSSLQSVVMIAKVRIRPLAVLLRQAGWTINDKRVERKIWQREGLKVKQPKRGMLWLADGSCIRLRPEHRNHVWSYDFVEDRTHDGRKYRMRATANLGEQANGHDG